MKKTNQLVHLNVQTNSNLSFSLISVEDLVNFCLENKIKTVSVSEYNQYDFLKLYFLCKEKGLKLIWGNKKIINLDGKNFLLNFFPRSYEFHKKLNNILFNEEIDFSNLSILMEYCLVVFEARSISDFNVFNVIKEKINNNFEGKNIENFYIGLNFVPSNFEGKSLEVDNLIPFFSIKTIKEDEETHLKILKKLQLSLIFSEEDKSSFSISYISKNEVLNLINSKVEKSDENNLIVKNIFDKIFLQLDKFCEKINLKILIRSRSLKINQKDFFLLEKECNEKLSLLNINENARDNYKLVLDEELEVIKKFNFSNYFLTINEIMKNFLKENIEIGPGRGSAVSSLVSYLLGITQIDPIKNKLFFWRFLNEKREVCPDIDIDINDQEKAFKIIRNLYGTKNIAKIVTKKKIGWTNALKTSLDFFDVKEADRNIIETNFELFNSSNISNSKSVITNIILEKYKEIFKFVEKISNLNFSTSTHPSGLIISKKGFEKHIPFSFDNDFPVCLYGSVFLEKIGFKKYDFLGLTESLGFVSYIKEKQKLKVPNYRELNINDKKTWNLINKSFLSGIFQINTSSFRQLISDFVPKNIEELVIVLSLNRPGASKNIEVILKKRNRELKIKSGDFLNKDLNSILLSTYGEILFEEQVTLLLSFSLRIDFSEGEILRKKIKSIFQKKEEFEVFRKLFFEKSLNVLDLVDINFLWKKIIQSIPYLFNKAHSISYASLTYYTAYLKANFFEDYFIFLIGKVSGDSERISRVIEELVSMSYSIIKPEINFSLNEWSIDDKKKLVHIGFSQLKLPYSNVFFSTIVKEREKNGKFKNWNDFIERNKNFFCKISDSDLKKLIKLNLFESLGHNSKLIISNFNFLKRYIEIKKEINFSNIESLPFLEKNNLNDEEEDGWLPFFEINEIEFEILGFSLSNFIKTKKDSENSKNF